MDLIVFIIVLLLVGLVVGAFARLALPGRDPMSIPMTIGVGIAGSFLAGLIGRALFDEDGGSSCCRSSAPRGSSTSSAARAAAA